ncbi:hypothetical protein [Lysobacter enzymogenes]|uniref:hypothetical protein n=1 Tax=Lysobacter enzymogenes TaxID=69 RepID=UPI001AF5798C|nr:hypothetical protein [Lysobacter enzymogenes]QQQ03361.1 hypothetical protein JHW41_10610 [Lysobacter enzymogenes]
MDVREAQAIITVSTTVERGCPSCSQRIGGELEFDESVRHLIQQHGYVLLHVGSQTTHDGNGGPWHSTVAVLGSVDLPKKNAPADSARFKSMDPPKSFSELGEELG